MKIGVIIRRVQRDPWPLGLWRARIAQGLAERGHEVTIITRYTDAPDAAPGARFVSHGEIHERDETTGSTLRAWRRFARAQVAGMDRTLSMDPAIPLDVWLPRSGGGVEAFFPHRTPKWLALARKGAPLRAPEPSRAALGRAARVLTFGAARAEALAGQTHDGARRVTPIGFASAAAAPPDRDGTRRELRRALGVAPERMTALLIAPSPSARAEELILGAFADAAARLRSRPALLIVGPSALGSARRGARLAGAARIVPLGPTRDLRDLILASDLVISPGLARRARAEAITTDAMALGAPVAALRRCETSELLLPGGGETDAPGVAVERSDPALWRRALEESLRPDRLETMTRAARKRSFATDMVRFIDRVEAALNGAQSDAAPVAASGTTLQSRAAT